MKCRTCKNLHDRSVAHCRFWPPEVVDASGGTAYPQVKPDVFGCAQHQLSFWRLLKRLTSRRQATPAVLSVPNTES